MVYRGFVVKLLHQPPSIMKKKFKRVIFCMIGALLASCSDSEEIQLTRDMRYRASASAVQRELSALLSARRDAVAAFIGGLSLDEKLSQLFLINLENAAEFAPAETDAAGNPHIPGGFLFFSYNIADTPEQIISFTSDIINTSVSAGRVPPLLVIDHEGGDVNRLRGVVSALPAPQRIAESVLRDDAERYYANQGEQLAALGFHLNLAPVAETLHAKNIAFLGSRGYGDTDTVMQYAGACIRGYGRAGVGTALKHFPGNTNTDPHTGLPELCVESETLEREYLYPFYMLSQYNPMAVLMSHVRVADFDGETPACLSSYWITDVLRNSFGYNGLVISDDILMSALAENGFPPEEAVLAALSAGIDMIMLSEKRYTQFLALIKERIARDPQFAQRIDDAAERIIQAKIDCGLLELQPTAEAHPAVDAAAKTAAPAYQVSLPKSLSAADISARVSRFAAAKARGDSLYAQLWGEP